MNRPSRSASLVSSSAIPRRYRTAWVVRLTGMPSALLLPDPLVLIHEFFAVVSGPATVGVIRLERLERRTDNETDPATRCLMLHALLVLLASALPAKADHKKITIRFLCGAKKARSKD